MNTTAFGDGPRGAGTFGGSSVVEIGPVVASDTSWKDVTRMISKKDGMSVAVIGTRGYPSYYGGFETAVRRIAPFLANQGWNVTVYGREKPSREHEAERDPRVAVRRSLGIDSRSLSTLSNGLTSIIDASYRKPDVALVMNVANGFWLPLLYMRRIPMVVNVDGLEWEREKWGVAGKKLFRWGAEMTARWSTRIVCDSTEIRRRWISDFGRTGDFIPYGGDTATGLLKLEPGLTRRAYVLVVARFVPENTLPQFIAAAAELAERYDVVIVGSSGYGGELEERVRELAESTPRVRWLGHISDDDRLHALWQHAGAYFHGHSAGGTNPALVQAMALGAPTVARDTPFNREVLGENAVFVAPEPRAIVKGIDRLMGDVALQDSLSSASIRRAEEKYPWRMVCEAYERSLLAAIEGRQDD